MYPGEEEWDVGLFVYIIFFFFFVTFSDEYSIPGDPHIGSPNSTLTFTYSPSVPVILIHVRRVHS